MSRADDRFNTDNIGQLPIFDSKSPYLKVNDFLKGKPQDIGSDRKSDPKGFTKVISQQGLPKLKNHSKNGAGGVQSKQYLEDDSQEDAYFNELMGEVDEKNKKDIEITHELLSEMELKNGDLASLLLKEPSSYHSVSKEHSQEFSNDTNLLINDPIWGSQTDHFRPFCRENFYEPNEVHQNKAPKKKPKLNPKVQSYYSPESLFGFQNENFSMPKVSNEKNQAQHSPPPGLEALPPGLQVSKSNGEINPKVLDTSPKVVDLVLEKLPDKIFPWPSSIENPQEELKEIEKPIEEPLTGKDPNENNVNDKLGDEEQQSIEKDDIKNEKSPKSPLPEEKKQGPSNEWDLLRRGGGPSKKAAMKEKAEPAKKEENKKLQSVPTEKQEALKSSSASQESSIEQKRNGSLQATYQHNHDIKQKPKKQQNRSMEKYNYQPKYFQKKEPKYQKKSSKKHQREESSSEGEEWRTIGKAESKPKNANNNMFAKLDEVEPSQETSILSTQQSSEKNDQMERVSRKKSFHQGNSSSSPEKQRSSNLESKPLEGIEQSPEIEKELSPSQSQKPQDDNQQPSKPQKVSFVDIQKELKKQPQIAMPVAINPETHEKNKKKKEKKKKKKEQEKLEKLKILENFEPSNNGQKGEEDKKSQDEEEKNDHIEQKKQELGTKVANEKKSDNLPQKVAPKLSEPIHQENLMTQNSTLKFKAKKIVHDQKKQEPMKIKNSDEDYGQIPPTHDDGIMQIKKDQNKEQAPKIEKSAKEIFGARKHDYFGGNINSKWDAEFTFFDAPLAVHGAEEESKSLCKSLRNVNIIERNYIFERRQQNQLIQILSVRNIEGNPQSQDQFYLLPHVNNS